MNKRPPKKRNEKSNFPKRFLAYLNNNPRERIAAIIVVLLVIASGVTTTLLIQHHRSVDREKQSFLTAEINTQEMATNIERVLGEPDDSLSYRECSKPNQEFNKGPLGCSVGTTFVYGVTNSTQVQERVVRADKVVLSSTAIVDFRGYPKGFPEFATPQSLTKEQDYSEIYLDRQANDMQCGVSYSYFNSQYPLSGYGRTLRTNEDQTLQIDIGCSHSAMLDYYPLTP